MKIRLDDLMGEEIKAFLEAHIEHMKSITPPESKHALDLEGLRVPEVSFWTMEDNGTIVACGALKLIEGGHGEIKSMRTDPGRRREGLGAAMLQHIISFAVSMDLSRLSLETGSSDHFLPARRLYEKFGFQVSGPFSDYEPDDNSTFMTLDLENYTF